VTTKKFKLLAILWDISMWPTYHVSYM